jgi:ABC-type transport system involved in multi-copper enzyme maturation permease subunit
MLWVLVQKETVGHLLSLRFQLSLALVIATMVGGAWVFRGDFESRLEDFGAAEATRHEQLSARAQRQPPLVQVYSYDDQAVMARPGALGFVSEGHARDLPNVVRMNAFRIQGPELQQRGNPMLPSFEALDWALIVALVLSFAALVLTFDGFAGEKADGTLRLLLANPVPRWQVVVAKAASAWGLLVLALLLGTMLQLLVLLPGGWLVLDADTLGKLTLALVLSALYVGLFVLLGLFISARHRRASSALVVSLLAWALFVIVVPRSGALLAQGLRPVDSLDEVQVRANDARRRTVDEYLRLHPGDANRWISGHWSEGESLELAFQLWRAHDAAYEDWRQQQLGQVALARRLAWVSPAAMLAGGLEAAAGTGLAGYRHFLEATGRYRAALEERLRALYPLDPVNAPGRDQQAEARLAAVTVDPADLPAFDHRPPRLGEAVAEAGPALGVLGVWDLLLFLAAVVAAVRYDVR